MAQANAPADELEHAQAQGVPTGFAAALGQDRDTSPSQGPAKTRVFP
jgi:hypothetical protein